MSPRVEGKVRICCGSEEPVQSATGNLLMVPEIMRMLDTQVAGVPTRSYVHSSPGPNESPVWSAPLEKATSKGSLFLGNGRALSLSVYSYISHGNHCTYLNIFFIRPTLETVSSNKMYTTNIKI